MRFINSETRGQSLSDEGFINRLQSEHLVYNHCIRPQTLVRESIHSTMTTSRKRDTPFTDMLFDSDSKKQHFDL